MGAGNRTGDPGGSSAWKVMPDRGGMGRCVAGVSFTMDVDEEEEVDEVTGEVRSRLVGGEIGDVVGEEEGDETVEVTAGIQGLVGHVERESKSSLSLDAGVVLIMKSFSDGSLCIYRFVERLMFCCWIPHKWYCILLRSSESWYIYPHSSSRGSVTVTLSRFSKRQSTSNVVSDAAASAPPPYRRKTTMILLSINKTRKLPSYLFEFQNPIRPRVKCFLGSDYLPAGREYGIRMM